MGAVGGNKLFLLVCQQAVHLGLEIVCESVHSFEGLCYGTYDGLD